MFSDKSGQVTHQLQLLISLRSMAISSGAWLSGIAAKMNKQQSRKKHKYLVFQVAPTPISLWLLYPCPPLLFSDCVPNQNCHAMQASYLFSDESRQVRGHLIHFRHQIGMETFSVFGKAYHSWCKGLDVYQVNWWDIHSYGEKVINLPICQSWRKRNVGWLRKIIALHEFTVFTRV